MAYSAELLDCSDLTVNNEYRVIASAAFREKEQSETYEVEYRCDSLSILATVEFKFYSEKNESCNMIIVIYTPDATTWQFKLPFKAKRVEVTLGTTVTLQQLELYAVVPDNVTLSGLASTDTTATFTGKAGADNYSNQYTYVKDKDGKITALKRQDGTTITVT